MDTEFNKEELENKQEEKKKLENKQKEEERYEGGDPFYRPGAHFDNWMGGVRQD